MTQINPENIKAGDEVQIENTLWGKYQSAYLMNGTHVVHIDERMMIVETSSITAHRPAFDWGDLREGMAFKDKHGSVGVFFGNHDPQSEFILLCMPATKTYRKDQLTRHPEGDIKEQEDG